MSLNVSFDVSLRVIEDVVEGVIEDVIEGVIEADHALRERRVDSQTSPEEESKKG